MIVRRVPLVLTGTGPVAERFSTLVQERGSGIAGRLGLTLDMAPELGPEPSVLVDTVDDDGIAPLLHAVLSGHAAVTTGLVKLVRQPVDFAVLRADRRLGMAAALLPGLPLVEMLARHEDAGDVVEQVEIEGASPCDLVDEALAVAALLGLQSERQHVRLDGDTEKRGCRWRAVVGAGQPVVSCVGGPPPDDVRTAIIRTKRAEEAGVTLCGSVGGTDRIVRALLADVLALALECDTPWRAHRRQTWRLR